MNLPCLYKWKPTRANLTMPSMLDMDGLKENSTLKHIK